MKFSVLCGASALAFVFSPIAMGQEADAPEQVVSSDDVENEMRQQQIVVTGSRITRSDYVAESPIMTLSEDMIEARGPSTLDATFNQLPQFAASNTGASSRATAQGRNNANLRGLGIQRTLVLMDGRRMQPSDSLGAIDLNTVSPSLIKNVEVITGGASAVYGSDAIAGVINFILDKDFEGFEVDAQYGITSRDDGETVSISATMGQKFDNDRGHFIGSFSYYDRATMPRDSRPFFEGAGVASALRGGYMLADAGNLPDQAVLDGIFTGYGEDRGPNQNARFALNEDGTVFSTTSPVMNLRYPDGSPYVVSGGRVGVPIGTTFPLQIPVERYSAFFNASYNITDSVEAYMQFNHVEYSSAYSRDGWSAGSGEPAAQIPVTNPFISDDLAAILASRPDPTAPMNFIFSTSRVGVSQYDFSNDLNSFTAGFRGDLGFKDWTWDAYGMYGTTKTGEESSGWIDIDAWNTLVNAPDGGASICEGGFNPFAAEILEQQLGQEACFDYLNRNLSETTEFTQNILEASMQGGLFELPAGEVRFAAGMGYRRQTYDYTPAGERERSEVWPVQPTGPTSGSYDVYELYGEAFVPILRDLPAIEEFNLSLAYRISDYNVIGSANTYKANADWVITPELRFRGGYQRAIRAPSLGELYAPPERSSSTIGSVASGGGDPCSVNSVYRDPSNPNVAQIESLCLAQGVPANVLNLLEFVGTSVAGINSGNLNLEEETADTYTAGFVWQPKLSIPTVSNFSLSVDYYDISVEHAIGTITASEGLARCFNTDGTSNSNYDPKNYFCSLTTRDSSGGISSQLQPTVNLAAYEVSGMDIQADILLDLEDFGAGKIGTLGINFVASNTLEYKLQNVEGAPFLDFAGTIGNGTIDSTAISHPEWKTSLTARYSIGDVDVTLGHRWYDSMTHASDVGVETKTRPGVASRQYFDLGAEWQVTEGLSLRAGIQNMFDEEPPEWVGDAYTDLALYDLLQKRYYIAFKHHF